MVIEAIHDVRHQSQQNMPLYLDRWLQRTPGVGSATSARQTRRSQTPAETAAGRPAGGSAGGPTRPYPHSRRGSFRGKKTITSSFTAQGLAWGRCGGAKCFHRWPEFIDF